MSHFIMKKLDLEEQPYKPDLEVVSREVNEKQEGGASDSSHKNISRKMGHADMNKSKE